MAGDQGRPGMSGKPSKPLSEVAKAALDRFRREYLRRLARAALDHTRGG